MHTLLLDSDDVRANAPMTELVSALEDAFGAYQRGDARMPAKSYIDLPEYNGDFRSMPAYLHVRGDSDGSEEWLPAKIEGVKVKAGDLLYFNTWGGGGWGDPYARDPALVAADVARGLVTPEGARRYGVVISEQGEVDTAATEALRAELVAQRGEIELFNRGGSVEDLRARCEAETHLPAPVSPNFLASA